MVGYDLDNNWLILLLALVKSQLFSFGWGYDDIYSAFEQQNIVNRVESLFQDDGAGVPTDTLFEQVKASFKAELQWSFPPKMDYFDKAINALGRHDMDTIAKLGAIDLTRSCEQAETPWFQDMTPVNADWLYGWDFRDAQGDWYINDPSWGRYTEGSGFWAKPSTTDNRCSINVRLSLDQINNGSVCTWIGIVLETLGDENFDNNYVFSGVQGATDLTYADVVALTGENPALAGVFVIGSPTNNPLGSGDNLLQCQIAAYHPDPGNQHPDEIAYSQRVLAFAIAGTGPGPLATPPVWPWPEV
jgi:hypothetical protein